MRHGEKERGQKLIRTAEHKGQTEASVPERERERDTAHMNRLSRPEVRQLRFKKVQQLFFHRVALPTVAVVAAAAATTRAERADSWGLADAGLLSSQYTSLDF